MNNKDFDKKIKDLMQNFHTGKGPDWSAFEKKIEKWENDEPFISDGDFDKMMASKLESNRSSFSEKSWDKFEYKFSKNTSLANRVVYYQLSGAAILLLLLMLLVQLYPVDRNPYVNSLEIKERTDHENQKFPKGKETPSIAILPKSDTKEKTDLPLVVRNTPSLSKNSSESVIEKQKLSQNRNQRIRVENDLYKAELKKKVFGNVESEFEEVGIVKASSSARYSSKNLG